MNCPVWVGIAINVSYGHHLKSGLQIITGDKDGGHVAAGGSTGLVLKPNTDIKRFI